MSEPLFPEILTLLRQSAADGNAHDRLHLHLLERVEALEQLHQAVTDLNERFSLEPLVSRVEALEARPAPSSRVLAADHVYGATKIVPTSEAVPVATDQELYNTYNRGRFGPALRPVYDLGRQHGAAQPAPAIFPVEYADADGDGIRIAMEPAEETGQACWVVRNSRHVNPCHEFSTPEAAHAAHQAAKPAQPPAPQPAPPTAPTGELVERVCGEMTGDDDPSIDAHAAIREVAAWLDQQGQHFCSLLLREEAGR
jgi:hypothetical protein